MKSYEDFFRTATNGHKPYPYQVRLATDGPTMPHLLDVPTGLGKTAAVVLGWLYRRRFAEESVRSSTPRRLVYCLPMRTLVEQTRDNVQEWLQNVSPQEKDDPIGVHVLMGGEDKDDWDEFPERDAILIGTQDMLLSRALNRGYGMSRYRWPVHFALLNNDCQWVLDETQLMGVGTTTAAQFAGFRRVLNTFGNTHTLWMSATLDSMEIETVDHPSPPSGWTVERLNDDDRRDDAIRQLITAKKPCHNAATELTPGSAKRGYFTELADEVAETHQPGTLTLVVLNQVERSQQAYIALEKKFKGHNDAPELSLIHSRYRPHERRPRQERALSEETIPAAGRIVVATQAIEAGVDVSATTLFTELAPWSSLVQRFGRCNRRGTCGSMDTPPAQVRWIDIDTTDEKKAKSLVLPYAVDELNRARQLASQLEDVGFESLATVEAKPSRKIVHVIRRKDLLDLFDTTPDLSGNDLDVSRYIRDADDNDVQVYWRKWSIDRRESRWSPPTPKDDEGHVQFPAPHRQELCSVSVGRVRDFAVKVKKQDKTKHLLWQWNPLDQKWEEIDPGQIRPGNTLLFHTAVGGYHESLGWTGDPKHGPVTECPPDTPASFEGMGNDDTGTKPILLSDHLSHVANAAESLRNNLKVDEVPWESIIRAAWWHDVGKAHIAFQTAMQDSEGIVRCDPEQRELWAKSGMSGRPNYRIPHDEDKPPISRRGFRHELASALAWLAHHDGEADTDLVAYLIAAHHGKVRMSLRSMPNENRPTDASTLFARGVWNKDSLPSVQIGSNPPETTRDIELSLEPMKLGDDSNGRPSWLARVLSLRDSYGPFRLAWLEMLVCVADWRGSSKESNQ